MKTKSNTNIRELKIKTHVEFKSTPLQDKIEAYNARLAKYAKEIEISDKLIKEQNNRKSTFQMFGLLFMFGMPFIIGFVNEIYTDLCVMVYAIGIILIYIILKSIVEIEPFILPLLEVESVVKKVTIPVVIVKKEIPIENPNVKTAIEPLISFADTPTIIETLEDGFTSPPP